MIQNIQTRFLCFIFLVVANERYVVRIMILNNNQKI